MKILVIMLCVAAGSTDCKPYLESKPMDHVSCDSAKALYTRLLGTGPDRNYTINCATPSLPL